jgi:hypothetical protein
MYGRKLSWSKVLSRHFPRGIHENKENSQSKYPVSGPRFEPGTSRIRSRSAKYLAFRLMYLLIVQSELKHQREHLDVSNRYDIYSMFMYSCTFSTIKEMCNNHRFMVVT